jgi:uncharacterized membrane protein YbhN (UPF0104 family)
VDVPRSTLARVWKRLGRFLAWGLFAAFVAVVVARWGDEKRFLELLTRAEPWWVLAALVFQVGTYAAEAWLWHAVLARLGARVPVRSLVTLAFVKLFTDSVVPTGGVAGSVLVVRGFEKHGVDPRTGTTAILIGVIGSYPGLAIAILASLLILEQTGWFSPWVLLPIGAFGCIAVVVVGAIYALSGSEGREPRWKWLTRIPVLRDVLATTAKVPGRSLRDPIALGCAIGIEQVILILDAATLWALLRAIGQHPPFAGAYSALVIAAITGLVSVIPAGLGTFDAACVALLVAAGVGVEPALMSTILLRGVTQWLPMLPGSLLARRELAESAG